MNRYKREEVSKISSLINIVEPSDAPYIDGALAVLQAVKAEALSLHAQEFPEEYDYTLDDHVDAKRRSNGENPMSQEYQERVADKRDSLGVSQLSASGISDGSTYLKIYEDLLVKALRSSESPEVFTRIINKWREL